MDSRQLELILAIVEEGTFTRAADRLHIAQPAVSHQIKALERQLGFALFTRTPRGATPTPACQRLLPPARTAVTALEDARAAARHAALDAVVGRVRLGVAHPVPRAPVIRVLSEQAVRYPQLEVTVRRAGSQELTDQLLAGQLDLAVVATGADRIPPGLRARWLPPDGVSCAVATGHPLARTAGAELAEVIGYPLVTLPPSAGLWPALERAAAAAGVDLRVVYQANDLDLVLDLVAAGLGIALVPTSAISGRADLFAVPLLGSPLAHRAAIAWPARSSGRPAVQHMRQLLIAVFVDQPAVP